MIQKGMILRKNDIKSPLCRVCSFLTILPREPGDVSAFNMMDFLLFLHGKVMQACRGDDNPLFIRAVTSHRNCHHHCSN